MTYFSSIWIHDDEEYPILLVSELDDFRYEIRKIEIWRNGKIGWADKENEVNNTGLGTIEIPSLDEINLNKEFRAWEISCLDFENFWSMRNTRPK